MIEFDTFDFNVVLFVICVGYMIKHYPLFKWVDNNFIPFIVVVIAGLLYGLNHGVCTFPTGLFLGLIAIGMYEVIDKVRTIILKEVEKYER